MDSNSSKFHSYTAEKESSTFVSDTWPHDQIYDHHMTIVCETDNPVWRAMVWEIALKTFVVGEMTLIWLQFVVINRVSCSMRSGVSLKHQFVSDGETDWDTSPIAYIALCRAYTVSEKSATLLLPLTLPYANWLSKFFNRQTLQYISDKE